MRRRLIIVGLLILVAIAVRGIWEVYNKERDSRLRRQEAEAQLANLEGREASLRADIAQLKSDRGIEEVLRQEYELAREGEGVVVIVGEKEEAPPPEPSSFPWLEKAFPWW